MQQPEGTDHDRFGYQPALDGLRGLAVTLVLLFHGEFAWMRGGYVGVSVFFTLSGFLITSLLILERERSGRVSWSGFVTRRAKRLLPASLLCLVAISLLAWQGRFAGVPHLRRDVSAATLQVANWNSLAGSGSYADMLTRAAGLRSPVEHFWSLAVEEQFYWVWPLAFMLLARVSKGRTRVFVHLAVLATVGVVAARVIALQWGPDVAYWATPARLGEILVGAALGAACIRWPQRPRWLGLLGAVGLAVVLWAALTWPTRGGPAYSGWFGVFSLASAALILGLQAPGILRRVFAVAPLVSLGKISYGVYVYHWPIYLLITPQTLHTTGWALFGLRIAVTLAVAVASYWLVERPVRYSRPSPRRSFVVALPVLASVVALAALVVPGQLVTRHVDAAPPATSTSTSSTVPPTTEVGGTVAPTTTEAPLPDGPISVLLLGDSTAERLAGGLDVWSAERADRRVTSLAESGCGVIRGTELLGDDGGRFVNRCAQVYAQELPAALAAAVPDVVVILVSIPDVTQRQWHGDEGMLSPTDPRYRERQLADYRMTAQMLVDAGVRHIAWVMPATPADWWVGWMAAQYQPADWDALRGVIDDIAALFPDVVQSVRLDDWFATTGAGGDQAVRDDGLHFTPLGAQRIMDEFLGPVLLRMVAV